ncbi:hypothetical protein HETIRDRAFT_145763, partial [Heterobasidion irregulare TC 32-1]
MHADDRHSAPHTRAARLRRTGTSRCSRTSSAASPPPRPARCPARPRRRPPHVPAPGSPSAAPVPQMTPSATRGHTAVAAPRTPRRSPRLALLPHSSPSRSRRARNRTQQTHRDAAAAAAVAGGAAVVAAAAAGSRGGSWRSARWR